MNDIMTEYPDPLMGIDGDDLWKRGIVYITHRHALIEVEMEVQRLEHNIARMQYEHEMMQRVRDKAADPEARQVWEDRVNANHDFVMVTEQELADAAESAAYHRAMVAEIEADLGENAQAYAAILSELEWDEENADEICPFIDECPIMCEDFEEFDDLDEHEIYEVHDDNPNDIIH